MTQRIDTYEINLAPGRAFNGPAAPVPVDLGTDPLLRPPSGYQFESVNPGPTRPGRETGISSFLVNQDVSCIDPYNLYNRIRGSALWLAAYQLTVDETNGPFGGGVIYMGRPNQDSFPIRLFGPGEAQSDQDGCVLPLLPGWVIYTRVQDIGGAPLPGEHKLTLTIVAIETLCDMACAIRTSSVIRSIISGSGEFPGQNPPAIGSFDDGSGGNQLGVGPGQTGTVLGGNLGDTTRYNIIFVDIDGVEFVATLAAIDNNSVGITVDTTGAALGAGEVRCVPVDPFNPITTAPVLFV